MPLKREKRRASSPPQPLDEPVQPVKRKRGRPPKVRPEMVEKVEDKEEAEDAPLNDQPHRQSGRGSLAAALTTNGLMNSVEQVIMWNELCHKLCVLLCC